MPARSTHSKLKYDNTAGIPAKDRWVRLSRLDIIESESLFYRPKLYEPLVVKYQPDGTVEQPEVEKT
jgi:hypothetical protein